MSVGILDLPEDEREAMLAGWLDFISSNKRTHTTDQKIAVCEALGLPLSSAEKPKSSGFPVSVGSGETIRKDMTPPNVRGVSFGAKKKGAHRT